MVIAVLAGDPLTAMNERTAIEQDKLTEGAILRIVLDLYPSHLTEDELYLEANGSQGSSSDRDAVQRAIGALDSAGLIHRTGQAIWPTRPARYFDWLGVEGSLIAASRPIA